MHTRQLAYLAAALFFSLTCGSSTSKTEGTAGSGGGSATGGTGGSPPGGTGGSAPGGTGGRGGTGGGAPTGGVGGGGTGGVVATGGTGGSAGTGGSTGGTGGTPPSTGASVLERNKNPSRDGHFLQPRLTKAAAATMRFDTGFKANFTGSMWATPTYLENGPGGKGVFFAVTLGNDVYALDETTGAIVWMKNLGTPAGRNGPNAPCGNIRPLGILATPVIDAATRTIFISAAVGDANQILRHEVHGLSVDDGSSRPGWPVDVSKALAFDPQPHNPRSALSLVNGIIYIPYGGHLGDCGGYKGRVVAIDSKDPTKVSGWAAEGTGSGIWAPGGLASDGTGVFATTGNGTRAPGGAHLDSEQVMRIRGMGTLNRGVDDVFFPTNWLAMDNADADFGSSSPMVIDVPGSTPSTLVVAPAKWGNVFFLDSRRLGGMGGQLHDFSASVTQGSNLYTAPTGYQTTKGTFVALTARDPRCPGGPIPPGANAVLGIRLVAGTPPRPEAAWCSLGTSGSPISSTVDGKNEAIVWYVSGNRLIGVDGETGAMVYSSGNDICDGVTYWNSPIAVKGRLIISANGRLCAWKIP